MRKYLLMMAMPFIALSAFASGEEKPTLNAVCVTLNQVVASMWLSPIDQRFRPRMESYVYSLWLTTSNLFWLTVLMLRKSQLKAMISLLLESKIT